MKNSLSSGEIAIVNFNKRALFTAKTNKSEALTCYIKAEQLLKLSPSIKLKFLTYNNLACFYENDREYEKALSYLKICEKLKSDEISCKIFLTGSLLNQSSVLSKLNRHEDALVASFKALNILEKASNPCLNVMCLYAIALEYEFLLKNSYAEKYYLDCKESANLIYDKNEPIFKLIEKGLKIIRNRQGDTICVLQSNLSRNQAKRPLKNESKDGYYIKVDTTPWIEQDNLRLKSSSETPKQPLNSNLSSKLRKKYTRMSQDFNNSPAPVKLEEKLNTIGSKLSNLSGKLKNIENYFKSKKKKQSERTSAAIMIQRYFRSYLKSKAKKFKIFPFFMLSNSAVPSHPKKTTQRKARGLLQSIIFLQKWIRGHLVRKRIEKQRTSALKIQKTFRMYRVKKLFASVKNAIVFIQQSFRSYKLCKNQRLLHLI